MFSRREGLSARFRNGTPNISHFLSDVIDGSSLAHPLFSAPFDLLSGRRDLFRCFSAHLHFISLCIPWALGGALTPLGTAVPFWVAMLVALANALFVLRFLPETRWTGTTRAPASPAAHSTGVIPAGWRQVLRHPVMARLVAVNLLFTGAFTAIETVFVLFTQHTLGWTVMQNGYIFMYLGVLIVLMQGGLVGHLARRWGEGRLLLAGLGALAIGLAFLPWSTNLPQLLIVLGIVSIGDGAVTPMVSALLSFASPPEARGETLGLAQAMAALAAGSAFAVGGPGAPFLAGSALVLLAALIALAAYSSKRKISLAHSTSAVQSASSEESNAAISALNCNTDNDSQIDSRSLQKSPCTSILEKEERIRFILPLGCIAGG
jgi:hypothetical protein